MKVLGIIAEYNPFHKGHAYQIEFLKKETDADYTIIAMSGNFVQRGAPALMEKYSRARMALSCGADLVLELPVLYAAASAEYFARGGIALLEGTGVVTHLGFGTESDNFGLLQETADILNHPPEIFQQTLQQELKKGLSFPAARFLAVKACFGKEKPCKSAELEHILASPNNILAIEYLKALSHYPSNILPCPLLRRGQSYHDASPGQEFCSASAIRAYIQKPVPSCPENGFSQSPGIAVPADAMPKAAFDILRGYPHPFLQENDFSGPLHYKLLTESAKQLSRYADVSPSLAQRIKKEAEHFLSWSSFCDHLKSKDITYARLSRMLLHIILNIYEADYQPFQEPSYLRVLGFRRQAASLLTAIKAQGQLPIVTRLAAAPDILPASSLDLLNHDLNASSLYRIGLAAKGDSHLKNDYRQPFLCL